MYTRAAPARFLTGRRALIVIPRDVYKRARAPMGAYARLAPSVCVPRAYHANDRAPFPFSFSSSLAGPPARSFSHPTSMGEHLHFGLRPPGCAGYARCAVVPCSGRTARCCVRARALIFRPSRPPCRPHGEVAREVCVRRERSRPCVRRDGWNAFRYQE